MQTQIRQFPDSQAFDAINGTTSLWTSGNPDVDHPVKAAKKKPVTKAKPTPKKKS